MIEFKNVTFAYEETKILKNISFCLNDGEFVGILGPNGGGKSTFLKLALGLVKPQNGTITRTDKKVSYIAQTTSISDSSFPATVEEIVGLGLVNSGFDFHFNEKKKKIDDILRQFDLYPLRKRLINELSGGQFQRVKIAKALIGDPDLVVLDEPDAGMDEEAHESLVKCIAGLHEKKKSILFVSHHPHDLEKADRIYFIEDGEMLSYEQELERGHRHVEL